MVKDKLQGFKRKYDRLETRSLEDRRLPGIYDQDMRSPNHGSTDSEIALQSRVPRSLILSKRGNNGPAQPQPKNIDDDDPSVIYTGNWVFKPQSSTPNTQHITSTANSTAQLSFQGSGIIVQGYFMPIAAGSAPAVISFTLDKTTLVQTLSNVSETTMQNLFASQQLSNGKHTLDMVLLSNGSFALTNFAVYPDTPTHPPVGKIVGGVIGGVLAIALLTILFFFMKRRMYQRLSGQSQLSEILCDRCGCPRRESFPVAPSMYLGSEQLNMQSRWGDSTLQCSRPPQ